MWYSEYEDYPIDTPLLKERREPGQGIVGCEMRELNGWGLHFQPPKRRKRKGFLRAMLSWFK